MSDETRFPAHSLNVLRMPVTIEWQPQEDITAYELALLLPLFHRPYIMPEDVPTGPERRHLVVHDPNTRASS